MEREQISLSQLLDLAVIYLGLAHGTDGELDPSEAQAIEFRLREQLPDKNPALIHHVMREATLTYLNLWREAVENAVDALRTLSEAKRLDILQHLSDIAHADSDFEDSEKEFIRHVARKWALEYDPDVYLTAGLRPQG